MSEDITFERKIDLKLILSIIAAGAMTLCGVIIETSMNITFPTLMKEFGIGTSTVQWITTGYLLVLAIIMPTSAFLQKRFKMKHIFITATVMFIIGTIICAAAPVFVMLLLGRLIQGVGTGLALPLMYNIVLEQAPYDKMGTIMGIATLIPAAAPAIGPSLGGLIVTYLGWRMIFVLLLPVLVAALIIGCLSIRQAVPTENVKFDIAGLIYLGLSFTFLILAMSFAGSYGWGSMQFILPIIGFAVMLLIFAGHAMHSSNPLIHLDVFKNRQFTFTLFGFALIQFICLGIGFLVPNFSQLVHGTTAFVAGCILLPGCALFAVLSPLSGKILDRKGAALPFITGSVCFIVSQILFTAVIRNSSTVILILIYMLFTFGQGITVGNALTYGLSSLPENRSADGNSVYNTMQQLFGALGTSVVSTVVADAQTSEASMTAGTVTGTYHAFMILTVLAICVALFLILGLRAGKKTS